MNDNQSVVLDAAGVNDWCRCEKPEDTFWERANLYSKYFVPDGWDLQYKVLKPPDTKRVLYLTGWCMQCRGKMRSGVSIPNELTGASLLEYIYTQMRQYRPYSGGFQETGEYDRHYPERSRWYRKQDNMNFVRFNEQFIGLFHKEDQPAVRNWVTAQHGEEEYTNPKRDRKSTLFQAMLDRARADGSVSAIEPIWDYYLPNREEPDSHDQDTSLTDYRFDISPQISFGSSEGIYVDVYLDGKFDDSGVKRTSIGVFKTLRTDPEACRLMGELCGVLMYHGSLYVDKEIHRYTPQEELKAEYRRRLEQERRKQEAQQ